MNESPPSLVSVQSSCEFIKMSTAGPFKKPTLPPPNSFKITPSTSLEDWKKWQLSFRYYAHSINLEQESHDVQLCVFKSLLGRDALEIYNKFSLLDITDVESVMRKFDEHFKPKFNVTLERYKLYNMHQQKGQRFDDFLSEITTQVDKCEFNSLRDDIILYKVVGGIDSDEIRNALLADPDLKYDKAVQICQASSSMHFMSDKENVCSSVVKKKRFLRKTPKISLKELRSSQLVGKRKGQQEGDPREVAKGKKSVRKPSKENSSIENLKPRSSIEKRSSRKPQKEDTSTENLKQSEIDPSDSEENENRDGPGYDDGDSDWRDDDDDDDDGDDDDDDLTYVYDPEHLSLEKCSEMNVGSVKEESPEENVDDEKRYMHGPIQKKKVRNEKPHSDENSSKAKRTCDICGKTLQSGLALERHRATHGQRQSAICFYCGKQFSKYFLRRHMTRIHYEIIGFPAPTLYSCDTCDFTTRHGGNLRNHIYQHTGEKPLACEFCEYRCIRPRLLKAHMAKLHTGVRPFSCSICKSGFLQSDALKKHMITHTTPEEKAKHRERLKTTCEVCGKVYSSKAALKTHSLRHTGEKPFACDKCGFRTVTNGALTSHLVTVHSEEKPFICTVCGYTCKTRSTLLQHGKTHLAEKPHSCELCGRKFSQATHVKRHMLTHTGDKPFACEICGHRWTTQSNLKQHMKVHEKHSGDGSLYSPSRKRQKKSIVVVVQSDGAGHSEHDAADAIITWSEQVSAINSIDYTPNLETPPPFHPTYPVHQGNPRPPDCRYYQQRQWQNQNYRQDQNQGQ